MRLRLSDRAGIVRACSSSDYAWRLKDVRLALAAAEKSTATRLRNFVEKAAQATLVGEVFDDAATGQGLLNFFLHGINCGAFTEAEASAAGVTLEELRGRSFVKILENRRAKATQSAGVPAVRAILDL
jgi:hypothetical protein